MLERVEPIHPEAMLAGEPPVRKVVALPCGTVIYGNIGAAARLDFIVIGPAVNLASRVFAPGLSRAFSFDSGAS